MQPSPSRSILCDLLCFSHQDACAKISAHKPTSIHEMESATMALATCSQQLEPLLDLHRDLLLMPESKSYHDVELSAKACTSGDSGSDAQIASIVTGSANLQVQSEMELSSAMTLARGIVVDALSSSSVTRFQSAVQVCKLLAITYESDEEEDTHIAPAKTELILESVDLSFSTDFQDKTTDAFVEYWSKDLKFDYLQNDFDKENCFIAALRKFFGVFQCSREKQIP